MAAGKNFGDIPKCLYHVNGKHLLGHKVQMLRQSGVNDIRVVVGWRKEEIEKFNRENNLGLELVYNPDWATHSIVSLLIGLQGVDDDVLIFLADEPVGIDVIEGLLKCEAHFCCIQHKPSVTQVFPWGVGVQPWICRVSRERLHVLKDAQKYGERWAAKNKDWGDNKKWDGIKDHWKLRSAYAIMCAIVEIFKEFKHEAGGVVAAYVHDIDRYEQTDEGRGMSFEK